MANLLAMVGRPWRLQSGNHFQRLATLCECARRAQGPRIRCQHGSV